MATNVSTDIAEKQFKMQLNLDEVEKFRNAGYTVTDSGILMGNGKIRKRFEAMRKKNVKAMIKKAKLQEGKNGPAEESIGVV